MGEHLRIELPAEVSALSAALVDAGHDAVLVGGAVRDVLMGTDVCDFDVVTDAPAQTVRDLAAGARGVGRVFAVGERFGTLGVALAGGAVVEVSRYRPDAIGRPTTSERFAADAMHRDFTVNAIGVSLADYRLLDPVGGRRDLLASTGVLRAPGEPEERFAEDPLRVVRGARFVSRLGFVLEPATKAAMRLIAPRLADVAPERLRVELTKLLLGRWVLHGLETLRTSGALAAVLPEVAALEGVTQPSFHDLDVWDHTVQTVANAPAEPVMRWAALLHDVGKAPTRSVDPAGRIRFLGHARHGAVLAEEVCARLRFSNDDRRAVFHLVSEHMRLGEVDVANVKAVDRAVRRLDLRCGEHLLVSAEDALELTVADFSATAHRAERDTVRERLTKAVADSRARGSATPVVSPVDGRELMRSLGIPEGPLVGAAKRAIERAVADGRMAADDRDAALRIASETMRSVTGRARGLGR